MPRPHLIRFACKVVFLLILWVLGITGAAATTVRPLKTLDPHKMLTTHPGAYLGDFDLSPDGRFIALLYRTTDLSAKLPDREFTFWMGVWEIDSGKLVKEISIAGPAKYLELFPNPQYTTQMSFSQGGECLVVFVGSKLKVLRFPELDTALTVNAKSGYAMRNFTLSQDGRVLAVASSAAVAGAPLTIGVYDMQQLESSSWDLQLAPNSLSLSPDGKQILFSAFPMMQGPHDADVLLLDTSSGKLLRSFNVDYPGGHAWGAGWVRFLGADRFITSPGGSVNTANDLKRGTLKIWSVATGKLIQELRYGPYGVHGEFAAFATSPVVAAITNSEDPAKVGCDEDCGSFRKWLLFDIKNSDLVYASDALHSAESAGPFDGEIRMSTNGKIVAVPEQEKIALYAISF